MNRISLLATMILSATVIVGRPAQSQVDMPGADQSEAAVRLRDATASALVRLVDSSLQKRFGLGWSVLFEPQYNLMTVRRNQLVLKTQQDEGSSLPNQPAFGPVPKPTLQHAEFLFRVQPFVPPAEYVRFKSENLDINAQMSKMQVQMRRIPQKFDSYSPRNDAEKKQVDAYERLKASRHWLPDLYFRDISLSWIGPLGSGWNPWSLATTGADEPKGWRREQADAAKAVLLLLTRYEPEKMKF